MFCTDGASHTSDKIAKDLVATPHEWTFRTDWASHTSDKIAKDLVATPHHWSFGHLVIAPRCNAPELLRNEGRPTEPRSGSLLLFSLAKGLIRVRTSCSAPHPSPC